MKLAAFARAGLAASLLAGCASPPAEGPPPADGALQADIPPAPQTDPGPGSGTTAGQLGMGTPMPGGDLSGGSMMRTPGTGLGQMDALAMCDLSRKLADAKTPGDRQALLERAMPGMAQQERERHAQMMRQLCNEHSSPPGR